VKTNELKKLLVIGLALGLFLRTILTYYSPQEKAMQSLPQNATISEIRQPDNSTVSSETLIENLRGCLKRGRAV
jgi:hypothetical protein